MNSTASDNCERVFLLEATTDAVNKKLNWRFEGLKLRSEKLKADFLWSKQWRMGKGLWLLFLGLSPPLSLHRIEFVSHCLISFDPRCSLLFISNPALEMTNLKLVRLAPGHTVNK